MNGVKYSSKPANKVFDTSGNIYDWMFSKANIPYWYDLVLLYKYII